GLSGLQSMVQRRHSTGNRYSMLDIVYENVTSAPTEAIVDLYRAGGWWQEQPAWRAAIPQMVRGSFCFLLARAPDGRIVGMGRVISDGASDGYIQDVVGNHASHAHDAAIGRA